MANISQLQQGSSDTLIVASRGNEIINAVNALMNMQVFPSEAGTFRCTGSGNAILTLNASSAAGNQAISDFIDTYVRASAVCSQDGTITVTLSNTYPTPQT
jgi:hypothetical protein